MNKLVTVLCFCLVGCNFDVGDCYLRSEGEGGVGGIIITATGVGGYGFGSTGSGGFGPVPPLEPQDMDPSPPVCNIVTQSPCNEKCQADYEADSVACGKPESEAQRRACGDSAYVKYRSCRERCENNPCLKICEERAEACEAECRKLPEADKPARRRCWEACNNAYAECIKRCKD